MKDYINVDYLRKAFPTADIYIEPDSFGSSRDQRMRIFIHLGDRVIDRSFTRTFLVNAESEKELQDTIIDIFKVRVNAQ